MDKKWWGPLVWKALHILAEQSDRVDSIGPWRAVFRLTADVLPCPVCREHFGAAIRRFHVPAVPYTAERMKEVVRIFLWSIHGESADHPVPLEDLAGLYGGERETEIRKALALIEEVAGAWTAERVPTWPAVSLWARAFHKLAGRLRAVEIPAPPMVPRRGHRTFPLP